MNTVANIAFTPTEKRVLWITCPCHFLCHFFVLVFPAVTMPLVATLAIPLEDVVRLSFIMYLAYGLFSLPVGLIVDHWKTRPVLIIGLLLMGTGFVVAGTWPDPHVMFWSLGLVGAGASVYHPAGIGLISRTVRQRGRALGINGIFGNLGIAGAPLITGILTWRLGWQNTFIVLGAFGLLTGVVLSFVRVDEASVERKALPTPGGIDLTRYFVIICVGLIFGGLAYRGNMLLLPAYLELKAPVFFGLIRSVLGSAGTATLAATVLTSLALVAGVFGQMMGGHLADRLDLRRAYLIVHACSVPFVLAMAFVSNYALALAAAGYAFFSLGMQPIENSLIAALTPDRWRSTSYAIKFILTFGVGASAVYVIAPIKHAFSLEVVYVFLTGMTLLLVASVVTLIVASRGIESIRNH